MTTHYVAMNSSIPRAPWPDNFPDVVIHGDLQTRDKHPNLPIAKAGNAGMALALVRDLLNEAATERIAATLQGRMPFVGKHPA